MESNQLQGLSSCTPRKTKKPLNFRKQILRTLSLMLFAILLPLGLMSISSNTILDEAKPSNFSTSVRDQALPPNGLGEVPQIALDHVPEASNYGVLYQLDVPDSAKWKDGVPYTIDNSDADINDFKRVAFLVQKEDLHTGQFEWIWVSMDAFTDNLKQLGLPQENEAGRDFSHQQLVTNLSVIASANTGLAARENVATGNIEIWSYGYTKGNELDIPNANNSSYDWGDTNIGRSDYGSFQVHDYGAEEVLFAYNRWSTGGVSDFGIGSASGGHKDHTFKSNAANYINKKIYVLIDGSVFTTPAPIPDLICNDLTVDLDDNGIAIIEPTEIYEIVNNDDSVLGVEIDQNTFDCTNVGDNIVTVTMTFIDREPITCESVVTVLGNEVSSCVIIAVEESHLHGYNTVISGDVCVTGEDGEAKVHEFSTIADGVTAHSTSINTGSSAGSVDLNPADFIVLPPFIFNTVSNNDSPDVIVGVNEAVTLDGSDYGTIEVLEGGVLTFTSKDIYIEGIKNENNTTFQFKESTNLYINNKLIFHDFTTFNPSANSVTLYVDDNVFVKKGSNISAHIYAASDKEINVSGEIDSPVYMKGLFSGKKVNGYKYITWEGDADCTPDVVDVPEPIILDCNCEGGMSEITFTYQGESGAILTSNSGVISSNDDGTFTISNDGLALEANLEIYIDRQVAQIDTSCSEDILGAKFPGIIIIEGYIDLDGSISTVEECKTEETSEETVASSARTTTFSAIDNTVTIEDEFAISGFSVKAWPIPSNDVFNIRVLSANNSDKVTIKVVDITGKTIHANTFKTNTQYQFGKRLNSGIYFVSISQGDNKEIKRLVKF